MRIALVWNADARLVELTVRHELFVRGFESLGHEVTTVCTHRAAEGYPHGTYIVSDVADLIRNEFWRGLNFDIAIMITWHRMGEVLKAMREAGTRTIAIADSDGQISSRVHPRARWNEFIAHQPRWDLKIRATKHFLQHYSFRGQHDDSEKLESTRQSDVLAFGTDEAKKKFLKFLCHYGQEELGSHLVDIPYPVDEIFCERTLPPHRRDRIVAIARWGAPQKDARLFTKALELCLARGCRTEFLILGSGGNPWFSHLADRFSTVHYLGVQPPAVVAELLGDSRAIVFASRWESGPIAALEALTLGCTVIGTPIPSFVGLTAKGRFGRVSSSRKPADLAQAICLEMNAWDEERRDPQTIAQHWRPKLSPAAVCRQMLDAITMVESSRLSC